MLNKNFNKVKSYIGHNQGDIIIAVSFILVALIAFGLGRLSVILGQKEPIRVEYNNIEKQPNLGVLEPSEGQKTAQDSSLGGNLGQNQGLFVGSKNSDKYHYPWCSGAQRIKEENQIWFSSKEEAEKLGYSPAGNCEGL